MPLLLVLLLLLLLLGGGGGYYGYSQWGVGGGIGIFGVVLIILLVYVPLLTLEGTEGKMFKPMATTMALALFGSVIFSLIAGSSVPIADASISTTSDQRMWYVETSEYGSVCTFGKLRALR